MRGISSRQGLRNSNSPGCGIRFAEFDIGVPLRSRASTNPINRESRIDRTTTLIFPATTNSRALWLYCSTTRHNTRWRSSLRESGAKKRSLGAPGGLGNSLPQDRCYGFRKAIQRFVQRISLGGFSPNVCGVSKARIAMLQGESLRVGWSNFVCAIFEILGAPLSGAPQRDNRAVSRFKALSCAEF